jgi:hypothetical protein
MLPPGEGPEQDRYALVGRQVGTVPPAEQRLLHAAVAARHADQTAPAQPHADGGHVVRYGLVAGEPESGEAIEVTAHIDAERRLRNLSIEAEHGGVIQAAFQHPSPTRLDGHVVARDTALVPTGLQDMPPETMDYILSKLQPTPREMAALAGTSSRLRHAAQGFSTSVDATGAQAVTRARDGHRAIAQRLGDARFAGLEPGEIDRLADEHARHLLPLPLDERREAIEQFCNRAVWMESFDAQGEQACRHLIAQLPPQQQSQLNLWHLDRPRTINVVMGVALDLVVRHQEPPTLFRWVARNVLNPVLMAGHHYSEHAMEAIEDFLKKCPPSQREQLCFEVAAAHAQGDPANRSVLSARLHQAELSRIAGSSLGERGAANPAGHHLPPRPMSDIFVGDGMQPHWGTEHLPLLREDQVPAAFRVHAGLARAISPDRLAVELPAMIASLPDHMAPAPVGASNVHLAECLGTAMEMLAALDPGRGAAAMRALVRVVTNELAQEPDSGIVRHALLRMLPDWPSEHAADPATALCEYHDRTTTAPLGAADVHAVADVTERLTRLVEGLHPAHRGQAAAHLQSITDKLAASLTRAG